MAGSEIFQNNYSAEDRFKYALSYSKLVHDFFLLPEAAIGGVMLKKVFLKISQIQKGNTYFEDSFE